MQTEVSNRIVEICAILNKNSVQYLIVGGSAVAFHGYFRWSIDSKGLSSEKFDLDFWYNPTYENYFNLLNSLHEFGQDVMSIKNEKEPNPRNSFFKFEVENFTIDFLPSLKGITNFKDSFLKKDIVVLNNTELHFICFDDLITDKSTNSRPKDLEDINELKKRRLDH